MDFKAKSIRTFIGAKEYDVSRNFYRDLGFEEIVIDREMSYFKIDQLGFYLQRAYVRDWINNSMIFLEVEDVSLHWEQLLALELPKKYKQVKLTPIRDLDWGRECFLHDPSGVLWHFGEFN
jgi:hypothetical protein